ncbi:hypothetical protein [Streptomyces sp. S465]|uniref:hypothetical protein n=1 Tax=Streptomyces sp. S465 TaxID=2979468 RepID=UPI0022A84727|nr:hypothetical protein [Streptomyces sp. S465]WAP57828.1 hypothetical protein N6H00_24295 [Streptomyces sp. S465]
MQRGARAPGLSANPPWWLAVSGLRLSMRFINKYAAPERDWLSAALREQISKELDRHDDDAAEDASAIRE